MKRSKHLTHLRSPSSRPPKLGQSDKYFVRTKGSGRAPAFIDRRIKHATLYLSVIAFALAGCATATNEGFTKTPQTRLVFEEVDQYSYKSCLSDIPVTMKILTFKKFPVGRPETLAQLRAYVFEPRHRDWSLRLPAIAMFHGGAWTGGSPAFWFPAAIYFASRGSVAVSFQYRLMKRDHPVVGQISIEQSVADAASAMRWLRKYQDQLGIDANRIVAVGESAGGQLALTTALVSEISDEVGTPDANYSSSPAAIVGICPVVDTSHLAVRGNGSDPLTPDHPMVSPLGRLKSGGKLPPTLFLHGSADDHVWASYLAASRFCQQANTDSKSPHTCRMISFPGLKHGFIADNPAAYAAALADIDDDLTAKGLITKRTSSQSVQEIVLRPPCLLDAKVSETLSKEYLN